MLLLCTRFSRYAQDSRILHYELTLGMYPANYIQGFTHALKVKLLDVTKKSVRSLLNG